MHPHFAGSVVFGGAVVADVDEAFNRLDALVGALAGSHFDYGVRRIFGVIALSVAPAHFEALASFFQVEEEHPFFSEEAEVYLKAAALGDRARARDGGGGAASK